MQRRTVLKRSGGLLALTVPLAGCNGNGSDDDEAEDEDDDSGDGDSGDGGSSGGESMGSVTENTVDGLEIVDWQTEQEEGSERYQVTVTVENVGEPETDAFNYDYGLTLYDSDDNDITTGGVGYSAFSSEVGPGETTDVLVNAGVDGELDDVARYELTLGCPEFGDTGSYCESSTPS